MKNSFKTLLAIGATLAILGAGCAPAAPETDVHSSQESVVNAFMTAVQAGDKEGAKAVVDTDGEFYQNFDEAWQEISSLTVDEYSIVSVDGTRVEVEMTITEDEYTDTDTEMFDVIEKDGKWWLLEP